jgi:arabinogalactan endo-1,4-beta-galactosidase
MKTKKDRVRERVWGDPISTNFGVLACGNDKLRQAILLAWRRYCTGKQRGRQEGVETFL